MSRNNLIRGLIKDKKWFFQITKTPSKRGTRFLTGDRPNEISFRALLESFTNKAEVTDKAYEDESGIELSKKQGLVTLATDAQVKARIAKSDSIARAVQPSQLPEIVAGDNIIITKDPNTLTHDRYIVSSNAESCPCVVGIGQEISKDIPKDTDIVVIYDGSSFTGNAQTYAKNLVTTWYESYRQREGVRGNMIEIQIAGDSSSLGNYNLIDTSEYSVNKISERFLMFPKEYIEGNLDKTVKTTTPDGTVTLATSVGTPTNNKCLFIVFEDEAGGVYHSNVQVEDATEDPNTLYQADYLKFVTEIYGKYDFFKMILYPAKSGWLPTTANFHAFLTKAVTTNLLTESPGLTTAQNAMITEKPAAGWTSTSMDFMTTNNPFYAFGVSGLEKYGISTTQYSFTTSYNIDAITNTQFALHVETALSGSETYEEVTIIPYIEFEGGEKQYGTRYTLKTLK